MTFYDFVIFQISEGIRLDISYESSAKQTIQMKYQALISLKIPPKNQNVVWEGGCERVPTTYVKKSGPSCSKHR